MTGTVRPRPPFAPTGPEIPRPIVAAAAPRKGRLRRDMALVALAIAVVMVSLEAGSLLVNATGAPGVGATDTPNVMAQVSPSASPSLSPSPSESPSDSPSPIPTASPSPSPSDSPSPSASARPSMSPTPAVVTPPPAPKITPAPVAPLMKPAIWCGYSGTTATCHVSNSATYYASDKASWSFEGNSPTKVWRSGGKPYASLNFGNTDYHSISLTMSRKGTGSVSANGSVPS